MSSLTDASIVRAAIHPAIGIARVGDSAEFFVGPEVAEPGPGPKGGYRDASGAIKRQAARFRVYGYDAAGRVVKELTLDDADIAWTVHVANKKAAWYCFQTALDIPGAKPTPRRNADIAGEARRALAIDPGPRSVSGRGRDGSGARFDSGTFMGRPVYLGELRTDGDGRLLFLGGMGVSDSPEGKPLTGFGDNDGWHDDTSDGPVAARVVLRGGREIPVEPAWVVTAPPNYGPDLVGFQTMHDVVEDVVSKDAPARPVSFTRDVYPVLRQLHDLQWANYGIFVEFGWDAPHDFLRPTYFAKLASRQKRHAELRRQVFLMFREPDAASNDAQLWPPYYGDNALNLSEPGAYMAVTPTIYRRLKAWAEGEFEADWTGAPRHVPLRALRVEEQPATLDKAALWFCLGGAFHPGCEMTWPMRLRTMYARPFRVRHRPPGEPEPDYGDSLPPLPPHAEPGPDTPYHAQGPGDLTRWMAVPWQTDTASCRSGYEKDYDAYLPTFWPARVPNHVLTREDYRKVMDASLDTEARLEAFNNRAEWIATLPGKEWKDQIREMVTMFPRMGILTRQPGPRGKGFPHAMYVADLPAPQGARRVPVKGPKPTGKRRKTAGKPAAKRAKPAAKPAARRAAGRGRKRGA